MNFPKKKRKSGQSGCLFIVGVGVMMIFMLVFNSVVVKISFSVYLPEIDERVARAAQFVLPIVMIFLEFWIYDRVASRMSRFKRKK